LLGIGRTGHVGFNEPGSHINSGTRIITLDHITRVDASSDFNGCKCSQNSYYYGVSLFCCQENCFAGLGQNKADIIKEQFRKTSALKFRYVLQNHANTIVLDQSAASELTRFKTPWLVGDCIWTQKLKSKAIVWLCQKTDQAILKLTDRDYNNNGMSDLWRKKDLRMI
jgi:glucosamine-6-phosphate deaminase